MSTIPTKIPTKEIAGDVAVGRNVAAGGDANIQGNARVGHDLVVEGWLEAANIKGNAKGLYASEAKLREKYPEPQDGWWALVGDTLPAAVYRAEDGEWAATGESAGSPTLDDQECREGLDALKAEVAELGKSADSQTAAIERIEATAAEAKTAAESAKADAENALRNQTETLEKITAAEEKAAGAESAAQEAKAEAEAATDAAEAAQETAEAAQEDADRGCTARFDGFAQTSGTVGQEAQEVQQVVFDRTTQQFLALGTDGAYYSNWEGDSRYIDGTLTPLRDKVYLCGERAYVYTGGQKGLVELGEKLYDRVKAAGFEGSEDDLYAALLLLPSTNATAMRELEFSTDSPIKVTAAVADGDGNTVSAGMWRVRSRGTSCGLLAVSYSNGSGDSGSEVGMIQTGYIFSGFGELSGGKITPSGSFHFIIDGRDCTAPSPVGNTFNATAHRPVGGFYTLIDTENTALSAVHAAIAAGAAARGMEVTYEAAEGGWKTWRYTGADTAEESLLDTANWEEAASGQAQADTAAGAVLNINTLCGDADYTLAAAIAAIRSKEAETGKTIAREGLVVTYREAEDTWRTKQFAGILANFAETGLWRDFGGGEQVRTSPTPAKDGAEAFTTGGAWESIPAGLSVTYEDNVLRASLSNAAGDTIGEEQQIVITGGGGGDAEGTVIAIIPERSPFYAKAGGEVTLRCAVRSVTKQGDVELLNTIERVELRDRDTSQLLETFRFNRPSSATAETFDFAFDLSGYFPLASQRKFKLTAHDDGDHTGSRNINVTAVDVTVKSEQTLNYTASTALVKGGAAKSLPMYRFPNNASDQGIRCTVEAMIDGEWRKIGEAAHTDTYAHSVSINPQNCLGKPLGHGALPLRIHGEDIASGVEGNWLYTSVMVVDAADSTPIVATRRYSDTAEATVKLYGAAELDYAVYDPADTVATAEVTEKRTGDTAEKVVQTVRAARSKTYTYTEKISGVASDGSVAVELGVRCGAAESEKARYTVSGSLLDIEPVTSQLVLDIDLTGRSNADADKTIGYGGYTLAVEGANWTTNGFVRDSFGSESYGTEADKGVMALRVAENVTARLDCPVFGSAAAETTGMAVQFRIRVRHAADTSARLMECISGGYGFYVTADAVVFTTDNAATVAHTITAALPDDTLTDVAIVVEPAAQAPYSGIGVVKMYFDGEPVGACYYDAGTLARHDTPVTFDGRHADLYLYNMRVWQTWYAFGQSFNNYLLKMDDTDAMVEEYRFNDVMASQAAEGLAATMRPQAAKLHALGLPYFVLCKNAETADTYDNYPDYLETLDGDKKTARYYDVYAYFPDRPWQDFAAEKVKVTNQGTTSSMRPVKNIKMKFKGCGMRLLRERTEFEADAAKLALYDECAANIAKCRVQPTDTSTPTSIITVKVDYSESGGANNGASCQLYNELQRALGSGYMTPAQNAYRGKYELNTSIDSVPIAFFRTDTHSSDATSPSYGYFHAKGNWNDDKGDAAVFGFEKVDGYNAACLNYGDFTELIAARDQTLDDFLTAIDKTQWDTGAVYVLSEFCGPGHRVFRHEDGEWRETTGTMRHEGGEWKVEGDAVNPVENYELRAYNAMDWFQGVRSVDDMLAADSKGKPVWLTYFESRYPDDDALNAAYEDGRKVPYRLYRWLRWCEECNHNLTAADGEITIDGETAEGTAENRLTKFKRELHRMANVRSMICYHVFTDYIAAVDQRSKNMMVGFYLDTDGEVRMYLNHLYDGDTILGSDNDCGLTIPALLDPDNDPQGFYQGHDSVLFTQLARADCLWLADYASDSDTKDTTRTVTVAAVAAAMRSVQNKAGLRPFSPQGIEKYWVTDRLSKWPKVVSAYDGIRKYVERSVSSANYFYALHGLGIQRLREFVATRFLYRDGHYQCGDTFSSAVSMRCTGTEMSVTVTAAKDGFFGIGVDRANEARESVYLKAGESATLRSGNTNTGSGVMLYIFGADCVGELDLRNATPKQSAWDISKLTLLRRLVIGGEGFTPATSNGDELSTLSLGQLPFLEELDIRNFPITSVDATYCPRLTALRAKGSRLATLRIAETSPIEELDIPATMTQLSLVNLPRLTYPGGLTLEAPGNITEAQVDGCPGIDGVELLGALLDAGAVIRRIALPDISVTGTAEMLHRLMDAGATGFNSETADACDGISGTWRLADLVEDAELAELQRYFPKLEIVNSQYTVIVMDDTESGARNITNLANGTSGEGYTPSGHIMRIRSSLAPLTGKLDTSTGKWRGRRLSDDSYRQLASGKTFDHTDSSGEGNDAMMLFPDTIWYKGINDYKAQKKYTVLASSATQPRSSATRTVRKGLYELAKWESKAIIASGVTVGEDTAETAMVTAASCTTFEMDVKGMRQVRWPGINSTSYGAVFTGADGKVLGVFQLSINSAMLDMENGDYLFTDVPEGAEKFVFTTINYNEGWKVLATDSAEVEAIEPDWVQNRPFLLGIYQASVDSLTQLRSVSGAAVKYGSNSGTTSEEWAYGDSGEPLNTPSTKMSFTYKDFQNLSRRRGKGYQMIDYEMWKLVALLAQAVTGTRDFQLYFGYGISTLDYTTGYSDTLGNADVPRLKISTGNKALGLEGLAGHDNEWVDYLVVNAPSWETAYKERMVVNSANSVTHLWRIYQPEDGTERTVKGIGSMGWGDCYCVARVRHGRTCDIVPTKLSNDSTLFAQNYADGICYTGSSTRVVMRGGSKDAAKNGPLFCDLRYSATQAGNGNSTRLAWRGEVEIADE